VGRDVKGRASLALYATALAFVSPWISYALFAAVAVMWSVPDRRLSRALSPSRAGRKRSAGQVRSMAIWDGSHAASGQRVASRSVWLRSMSKPRVP
jgi:hypothetical protein